MLVRVLAHQGLHWGKDGALFNVQQDPSVCASAPLGEWQLNHISVIVSTFRSSRGEHGNPRGVVQCELPALQIWLRRKVLEHVRCWSQCCHGGMLPVRCSHERLWQDQLCPCEPICVQMLLYTDCDGPLVLGSQGSKA